jgi:hypothetical protein
MISLLFCSCIALLYNSHSSTSLPSGVLQTQYSEPSSFVLIIEVHPTNIQNSLAGCMNSFTGSSFLCFSSSSFSLLYLSSLTQSLANIHWRFP